MSGESRFREGLRRDKTPCPPPTRSMQVTAEADFPSSRRVRLTATSPRPSWGLIDTEERHG